MDLTAAQLLTAVEVRSGHQVTPRQLRRMREEGLLESPQPVHKAGVGGSGSLTPAHCVDQVIAIVELLATDRSYDRALLKLWWQGYWVRHDRLRALLTAPFEQLAAEVREALDHHAGDRIAASKDLAVQVQKALRHDASWEPQRRRLTATPSEQLDGLIASWMALLNEDPAWELGDEGAVTPLMVIEQMTGVAKARHDAANGGAGWLAETETVEALRVDLVRMTKGQFLPDVLAARTMEATDQELDQARDALRWAGQAFGPVVAQLQSMFGPDAGGLGELPKLFEPAARHSYSFAALLGLWLSPHLVWPLVDPALATAEVLAMLVETLSGQQADGSSPSA